MTVVFPAAFGPVMMSCLSKITSFATTFALPLSLSLSGAYTCDSILVILVRCTGGAGAGGGGGGGGGGSIRDWSSLSGSSGMDGNSWVS